jgi:hypothetical protein
MDCALEGVLERNFQQAGDPLSDFPDCLMPEEKIISLRPVVPAIGRSCLHLESEGDWQPLCLIPKTK